MKVAILQCDDVLEQLQPQYGSYSNMIIQMFEVIDIELAFEIFNCQLAQYPNDINAFDFYITTGSRAGVYENEQWIHQLISFIQTLDKAKKKLIGICFGHQIIAMAKNQQVQQSEKGWGIGIAVNRITTTPEWMNDKKPELNIIVSHKDQVNSLPEEALIIAESDFCPFFVVQWNNHFLSIQGHPEWNTDYSKSLMHERREIIPQKSLQKGLQSLTKKPDNALFTRWMIDFVTQ